MGEYDKFAALALRLIKRKGVDVQLRRAGATVVPDPDKPWLTEAGAPATETVRAVFDEYEQRVVDGTIIHQGDQKVLIAAASLATPPSMRDAIVRDGEVWMVLAVDIIKPAELAILYQLQVRR